VRDSGGLRSRGRGRWRKKPATNARDDGEDKGQDCRAEEPGATFKSSVGGALADQGNKPRTSVASATRPTASTYAPVRMCVLCLRIDS